MEWASTGEGVAFDPAHRDVPELGVVATTKRNAIDCQCGADACTDGDVPNRGVALARSKLPLSDRRCLDVGLYVCGNAERALQPSE